jgi:hypothetical protein
MDRWIEMLVHYVIGLYPLINPIFWHLHICVQKHPPRIAFNVVTAERIEAKNHRCLVLNISVLVEWETHVLSHRFSPWSATSPEKSTSLTEPPSNDRWRLRALEIRPAGRQWCCATSTCPSNLANLVELRYGKRAPQWPMRMGKIKIISRISRMSRISRISRIGNDCQNLGTSLTI